VLWDRFSQACGIAPASWREGVFPNVSIGAIAAAHLLNLNQNVDAMSWHEYNVEIKSKLLRGPLTAYKDRDRRIGFTVEPWLMEKYDFLRGRLDGMVEGGMKVIGDLDELRPVDVPGVDPASVTAAELDDIAEFIRDYQQNQA
jgi:hypothetical protein